MKPYSFLKGFSKGLISFALFVIPFFITHFEPVANLTVGAVLMIVYNFLKF